MKGKEIIDGIKEEFADFSNMELMHKYGIRHGELMYIQKRYKLKKSSHYLKKMRIKPNRDPDDLDRKVLEVVQGVVGWEYTNTNGKNDLYIKYITYAILKGRHGDKERIGRLLGRDRCVCYNYDIKMEGFLRSDSTFKNKYNEAKKICNI